VLIHITSVLGLDGRTIIWPIKHAAVILKGYSVESLTN